jgi:hypothetical protein
VTRSTANSLKKSLGPADFKFSEVQIGDLPLYIQGDDGNQGGFNRSLQHRLYGSLGAIRREFPPVSSSLGFFGAWC